MKAVKGNRSNSVKRFMRQIAKINAELENEFGKMDPQDSSVESDEDQPYQDDKKQDISAPRRSKIRRATKSQIQIKPTI